jgi:hypothetical protein
MTLNDADNYHWIEEWDGSRERTTESLSGWAHPGMAVTENQRIVTCDSGESKILVFSLEGELEYSWVGDFTDAHGISIVREDGEEVLWIADNGSKRASEHSYEYPPGADQNSGRVFKCRFGGEELLELPLPDHDAYSQTRYAPTSVVVDNVADGGTGDIWVADGYGANLVHRFSKEGTYIQTIDGLEGEGRFDCPHGIIIDNRKTAPELYVADRANSRVQVYDLNGEFIRSFGSRFLNTPSGFSVYQDLMVVAELDSKLTILDKDDQFIEYLFMDEEAPNRPGWPNEEKNDSALKRPSDLKPGKFNSPHGMTIDRDGNIYVAEWLIGGRMTKLKKIN